MKERSTELREVKRQRDQAQERLSRFIQTEQQYTPRHDDPDSISGLHEKADSKFARRFNGIGEMSDLIQTGITHVCNDLLEISKSIPFYHINQAMGIAYDADCEAHRTALVGFLVMKLLQGASLRNPQQDGECHGEMKVVLNDNDLMIFWSKPICVPVGQMGEQLVLFQNPSPWAPKPDPQNFPFGIDPVSAKLILHRLNDIEINHLKRLILDPFMDLDQHLKAAYAYRDQGGERGRLVGLCYDLIHTMARALMKNYKVQIGRRLLEVFDEDELRPFHRDEHVPFPVTTMQETAVSWKPDMKLVPNDIRELIFERVKHLNVIWENICPEMIDHPTGRKLANGDVLSQGQFRNQLEQHFYIKHNFRSTSCRIESVATLLFQESTDFFQKPWAVMKLIANYLESEDGQARFREKIQSCGLTVDNVIDQYRRQGKSLISNDLEIEIAAHALGISIGVFVPGVPVKVTEMGLVEPFLFFGPKTKEKLFVLSDGGNSFYALEPRLVVPRGSSKDLASAITSHLEYWKNGNDDEERVMRNLQALHGLGLI